MKNKHPIDLKAKKEPKQTRSKATVAAIIQSATQLLIELGYAEITTNHVADRAGVSIGSLYEYFPGKEAIVAAVATQVTDSILSEVHMELTRVEPLDFEPAMKEWIFSLYKIAKTRHQLLKVLLFEVPFIHQVPAVITMRMELFKIAMMGAHKTKENFLINLSRESIYLITTMTGSTLLQLAMMPPPNLDTEKILNELTENLIRWFYQMGSTDSNS